MEGGIALFCPYCGKVLEHKEESYDEELERSVHRYSCPDSPKTEFLFVDPDKSNGKLIQL